MDKKHHLTYRLIAYILLANLFLQSCTNFSNPAIPTTKTSTDNIQKSTHPTTITQLEDYEFHAEGNYLVTFHQAGKYLRADAKVVAPEGFSREPYIDLEVSIAPDINLHQLAKLPPAIQKKSIHIHLPENNQPGRVVVLREGLRGGMTGGDGEKEKEDEKEPEDSLKVYQDLIGRANQGDSEAQFQLGKRAYTIYQECPTEVCAHEAREWLQKAANQGHQEAVSFIHLLDQMHLMHLLIKVDSPIQDAIWRKRNFKTSIPTISTKDAQHIKYIRELGSGGMGTVHEAVYQEETIAVKKLYKLTNEQIAAFKKEAIIIANLRHPNIISFLAFFQMPESISSSRQDALIMEYASQGSLWSLLKKHQGDNNWDTPWQLRYQIALDMADGLSYLHQWDIVHCDLKSENILLDATGRAKITDFGTAVLKSEATSYGEWAGDTPRWRAPELIGIPRSPKAGDVYSYGMLLWQLGARREPFPTFEKDIRGLINHTAAGNREEITVDTPLKIRELINTCWLVESERPTMKVVHHLLEEALPVSEEYRYRDYSFLQKEKEEERKVKDELTIQVHELEEEKQELKELNESLAKKKNELEEKNESLGKKKKELKEKKASLKDEREELNRKLEKEKQGLQELKELNESLAKKKNELEGKKASLGKVSWLTACIFVVAGIIMTILFYWLIPPTPTSGPVPNLRYQPTPTPGPVPNLCYQLTTPRVSRYHYNNKNHTCYVTRDHKEGTTSDDECVDERSISEDNTEVTSQNHEQNLAIYQEGSINGNATAKYNLGLMYENGWGVTQDHQKAFNFYKDAADQGNADAQNNLGNIYYNRDGNDEQKVQDYKEAAKCYKEASEQGYAIAKYNLGNLHYYGRGEDQSYENAKSYYEVAANEGVTAAKNNLGFMYQHGCGVTQDHQKAFNLYKDAADQGNAYAQKNLGDLYKNGSEEVTKNYQEALKWYRKAADQGHDGAGEQIILLTHVSKNFLSNLISQAEKGDIAIQSYLGDIYYYGWGIDKDYQKALETYQKAAKKEHSHAQFQIGEIYFNGWGVTKDYQKALEAYEKAADQGHIDVKHQLEKLITQSENNVEQLPNGEKILTQLKSPNDTLDLTYCYLNADHITNLMNEPFFTIQLNKKHTLYLYGNQIGASGVQELAKVLHKSQIHTLDLVNNEIDAAGAKELAMVLPQSQIHTLNLTGNNIGDSGIQNLAKTLPQSQIHTLDLSSTYIGAPGAKELAMLLPQSKIHTLNLTGNNIGDSGIQDLAKTLLQSKIHTLDLSSTYIGAPGAKELAMVLPHSQIHTLNLASNNIGTPGIQELAKALPLSQIHTLNLRSNKIGDIDIQELAKTLPQSRIHTLNLSHNNIYSSSIQILIKALPRTQIHMLNLWNNNIGDSGAKELANALPQTQIRTLNLWNNNIGDSGAQELAKVLPLSKIHTLELRSNKIGSLGAMELAKVLPQSKIQTLDLSSSWISGSGAQELAKALPQSKIQTLDLSSNWIGDETQSLLSKQFPHIKFIF
ncbi:MAG: hypothetical protein BGO68_03215 [Candidatus Amoebophilus sp. 36-38]|nr:MAG: hypothetical protein BGO68_03215 [Candidatus Amoebophilus sp. 36-38]